MHLGAPTGRVFGAAVLFAALALGGCRTSKEDVHRWANTANGPRKLVAVLTHDKYPVDLRVEAALTLIHMKPRSGRRIGIQGSDDQVGLIDALSQMPPAARAAIVARLAPELEAKMTAALPATQPGQPAQPDPSVPYKDAAFALLTHDSGSLLDQQQQQRLRGALASWASTNFAERLDDSSQLYGIEQLMRELKADGVRALPNLIAPGAGKIDRVAELIADFGDPPTKLAASQKLVAVAREVNSEAWIKQKSPAVEAANKASKLSPTPEQFRQQLFQYQEEELLRIFSSMKKVGGKPVVDYLLAFAQDKTQTDPSGKRRATALAALQGNLDRNNAAHAEVPLSLAGAADTPDPVRDAALARIGEFPRQMIVDKLYGLFKTDNWKVRWVAAELVLKTSETSELPTFFNRLGQADGFSITEPLRYGALISAMKGSPPPREVVDKYAGPNHPVPVRMSALGYYYEVGTRADLAKVEGYANDRSKAPACHENARECEWKCEVASGGARETKDITTLGDFVTYCVKPAMEARSKGK